MSEPVYAALQVEYDGTPFFGWARQPGRNTVEGSFLDACDALGVDVERLQCAGRTDAGVHASAQVVSLAYRSSIPPDRLAEALNKHLHPAVAVARSVACEPSFDARGSALSRAYEYRVLCRRTRSPLRATRVLHHPRPLDLQRLHDAAALLVGQHDFTAFTPSETRHTFFRRTVVASHWEQRGDELVYTIRANAFLRHMVRVLLGTMFAIGRGDWEPGQLAELLAGGRRADAHQTAPAHGLCLVDVEYDPLLSPFATR